MHSAIAITVALLSASALAAPAPRPDNHEQPTGTVSAHTTTYAPTATATSYPHHEEHPTEEYPTEPTTDIVFPPVTIQLSNDANGANAAATVVANGDENVVSALFGNTAVDKEGAIFATSVQLVDFPENVFCILNNNGQVAVFNSQQTFADLDGNAGAAVPVDVTNAVIICEI